MALKPRHKRRILWSLASIIGAIVLAIILIPPMITLNGFRPMIENAIAQQMNVPARLNGDLHFSLIGGATIVAHDVTVPTARIGSVMLSVPFSNLFNMQNAQLNSSVVVYDADISINKLSPVDFNHKIEIYNSDINFLGRKFHIVRAEFSNGGFHGTVRTKTHKYDVEFIGDTFHIRNKNNNLDITGHMFSDGTLRGQISLETNDINSWFGFTEPKITKTVRASMDFELTDYNSYSLSNIMADNFSGNITVSPNGDRTIQLVSNDIDFDFSFLLHPNKLLHKTTANLDFYGNLKLGPHKFHHIRIQAIGTADEIQITNLIADDIAISGGKITNNGAQNLMFTMPIDNTNLMCLFSGTPDKWECKTFAYGDLTGHLSVNKDKFDISVSADIPMPADKNALLQRIKKLGKYGTINFQFADLGGTYKITPDGDTVSYSFARGKTLEWLHIDVPFLPDFIKTTPGDFSIENGMFTFIPNNKQWQLSTYDNYFYITGTSFKSWLPHIDLRFINDAPYTMSGFFSGDKISNLTVEVSNHKFTGTVSGNNITVHTDTLSLDILANRAFIDNFAEQEFRTNEPLMTLFNLPVNIALSAHKLVYNNNTYQNFIYTLKPNTQTLSISDASRGNLLATIERENTHYDIFAQLNRFVINGTLLNTDMPLNIRDTMLTGQIELHTNGQIAHDIWYNMTGHIDVTCQGGYLIGMSFDNFYASAENITTLNAEYALANALTGGETALKQLRLIGDYSRDNFITTEPIELSMRHTTAIGGLAIQDGYMTAEFDLTLRGTAPTPAQIALSIMPNGTRQYSLSDIMRQLDTGFMRAFVKTHDKF